MAEPQKYVIMLLFKSRDNQYHTSDASVPVLPLQGTFSQCQSTEEAILFIEEHGEKPQLETFERYEIEVHYANGDFIKAQFQDKAGALAFLRRNQLTLNQ